MRTVSVSTRDWSLQRKGNIDQGRHQERLKEAVKNNLTDIVGDESIVTSDGRRIVKIPVRSLDLPRFRFGGNDRQGGQGQGGTKEGDVIARSPIPGSGHNAGDEPGEDYYEVSIDIDTLAAMVFDGWELPDLQQKQAAEMETDAIRFYDIRKKGPFSNMDKRRTIKENIRRNAMQGNARFGGIKDDDLRYRTWQNVRVSDTSAVVIAMRDVSGSMGEFEKSITRTFYYWMVKFLRTKYNNVQVVFITHHTEAKEVDEESFFTLGESGGTRVSSAYELAIKIMKERYPSAAWNIYPFHFSDGDNWGDTDNHRCVDLVKTIMTLANIFGYGEIRQGGYSSDTTLGMTFREISDPKYIPVTITSKEEVYSALCKFFTRRSA